MKIGVFETGTCNIRSILNVIQRIGFEGIEINAEVDLGMFDKIIFPGVGNYAFVMKILHEWNLYHALRNYCLEGKAYLGICLGMQILSERGYEGGETQGLSIIEGDVVKMVPKQANERIPHNGWNEVCYVEEADPLFKEIPDKSDFYFNHSFIFNAAAHCVVAKTPFSQGVPSVVRKLNTWGVQFHPEKSQKKGVKFLENFLKYS